jgi:hypothetical protein
VSADPLLEIGGCVEVTSGYEQWQRSRTAACQTLVDFVAKHAGIR